MRGSIEKSLNFLQADVAAWLKKTDCATCHHGAITTVVYCEAKAKGFSVEERTIIETRDWTKARFIPQTQPPHDPTFGPETPGPAIPLLAMSHWTDANSLSTDEIDRMSKFIVDWQQEDGAWAMQPRNPHPVIESREIMALWFCIALEQGIHSNNHETASISRASREKAIAWLARTPVADTTQAVALRLLVDTRDKKARKQLNPQINALLRRQNADGGWGQTKELASDAYATGQALYVLNSAGVKADRKEVQRGVSFLISTQKEDATWVMTPRVTPERPQASKNLNPINHFAVAWAALGLLHSLPEANAATTAPPIIID
jgi:squalene cyclase